MWVEDIADHLATGGIAGGVTGWGLAIGRMPASPNRMVGLFETAGRPPDTKYALRSPNLQVRVRAEKGGYEEARLKAEAVLVELEGLRGTVGGSVFVHFIALADMTPMGEDENERPEVAVNFMTAREE